MAEQKVPEQDTSEIDETKDRFAGGVDDPGEAHRKGYSADPPGTQPSQDPDIGVEDPDTGVVSDPDVPKRSSK